MRSIRYIFGISCMGLGLFTLLCYFNDRHFIEQFEPGGNLSKVLPLLFLLPTLLAISGFYQVRRRAAGQQLFFVYVCVLAIGLFMEWLVGVQGMSFSFLNTTKLRDVHIGFTLVGVPLLAVFSIIENSRLKGKLILPGSADAIEPASPIICRATSDCVELSDGGAISWEEIRVVGKQTLQLPNIVAAQYGVGGHKVTFYYIKLKSGDRKIETIRDIATFQLPIDRGDDLVPFYRFSEQFLKSARLRPHLLYEETGWNGDVMVLDPEAELRRLAELQTPEAKAKLARAKQRRAEAITIAVGIFGALLVYYWMRYLHQS